MADQTYEELEVQLLTVLSQGGTFWGKFTCSHCGTRQTFEESNKLFTSGICEECEGETKLDKWGVMVLFGEGGATNELL